MKDVISIKGERTLWLDFVYKVKKNKSNVWAVIAPFLRQYIKGGIK